MNRKALQEKLASLMVYQLRYPALEIHEDHSGTLTILDRSHTYSMASPRFTVRIETYDSIMKSESLDSDLYMMLTTEIGIDTEVALMASLEYDG